MSVVALSHLIDLKVKIFTFKYNLSIRFVIAMFVCYYDVKDLHIYVILGPSDAPCTVRLASSAVCLGV